ncbi:palmitoyltransferase ZDHHC15B isoform X2 [Cylas formicarius]|uniref:palmitoyltransferase ZDHHC15B isoform X2 n=1 Tax=Cylas formicarius TaxID=197179 RepID=UPI002958C649|nr:palmitoyltransferase ZDHHC15B isoform X2 [Cylas formicarius]
MAVSGTDSNGACYWCLKAVKWIPVLFIVTIVAWSYYAYVIQLCLSNMENTLAQILFLIFYHMLFVMFCWSYIQTIFTDIGRVPSNFRISDADFDAYMHNNDSLETQNRILENCAKSLPITNVTIGGSIRFCEKCKNVKPDRTHHCSVCGVCVLKMDHHCPWINNCVCFTNYKYFVLFLGYALLYCIYICLTSLPYFIAFWKGDLQGMGRFHIFFLFFVAIMFGVSLMSLFGYHCYLVLKNRTTLEAFRPPSFRGLGADKYGFHLGRYRNFKEVFGDNPKLWFLPLHTSLGDGIEYPVHSRHLQSSYHSMDNIQNSRRRDVETETSKLNPGQTEISIL